MALGSPFFIHTFQPHLLIFVAVFLPLVASFNFKNQRAGSFVLQLYFFMRHLFIFFVFLSIAFNLCAQMPQGQPPAGRSMQAPPSIGHIYGKLVDSLGKPVGDATVVIMQTKVDTVTKKSKEVLLKGMATKNNGEFDFDELPGFGRLKLKVSATGYKPYEQNISFQMKKDNTAGAPAGNPFDKDLGKIALKTDVQQLGEVTVSAVSGKLKMDIDKKVFNVDKNIVSAGGTALDVMKNVPSVQVDIDGNVKLRNAAPQLFIDGRPTTLTLDQIPADAIESVEVITNPSAKYDASGGNAGILNVVLKKNRKSGYNGNVRAGIDKRGGINGGGDLSVRQGKVNISAATMVNQMRGRGTGTTDQLNLFESPQQLIHQDNTSKNNGGFAFGKLGFDYFITNKTTVTLNGIKVHGEFKPNDIINYDITKGSDKTFANRTSNNTRTFNANGAQFGMKHLFAKEGEEITADGNYFVGKFSGNSLYTTDSLNNAKSVYATEHQKQIGTGDNKTFTVQTDYTKPLKGKAKIEAGLRANIKSFASINETYVQKNNSTDFTKIPSATSNYKNTDNVYAAYTTFTNSIKNFGYQVGLRAESSEYTGTLLSTGEKFKNNYPISLFPSAFLSQKLKDNQQVQLNYSRRINRPNFFSLIPFTDRTDPLNISRGNPDLVPEFTNSLEASYSKTFKKNNNILTSVYYKHTNNLITRSQNKEYDVVLGKDVLVNSYINANSSYSAGAELTSINYLTKWWDVTSNVNVYNSKINVSNINAAQQDALWSWFGKINNNFKLPKNFNIQLSANYQSKTNLPVNNGGGGFGPGFGQSQSASQGYIKSSYAVDMAFKKSFLKNNAASATLSFSDIFRTRRQEQHSESQYFVQDISRLRDPQMIRLNFAYRFGKMDMSLFKRKNMKGEGEGMQGAMQGVGQ